MLNPLDSESIFRKACDLARAEQLRVTQEARAKPVAPMEAAAFVRYCVTESELSPQFVWEHLPPKSRPQIGDIFEYAWLQRGLKPGSGIAAKYSSIRAWAINLINLMQQEASK